MVCAGLWGRHDRLLKDRVPFRVPARLDPSLSCPSPSGAVPWNYGASKDSKRLGAEDPMKRLGSI